MRQTTKWIIGAAALALASGTALAHDGIGLNFSIAVPGASAYMGSGPAYYPAPAYVAPPAVYYDARPGTYYAAPPAVYYQAPPRAYYSAPPGVSVYYAPSRGEFHGRRFWHRGHDRWHRDDDD